MGPTRRALFVVGLAVLSLSLVLSIAPAFATGGSNGGNATTGTVKIRDVASGTSFDDAQNDPQVCAFTVLFQFNDPVESGAWSIQVWPAGSTPTVVASGTYDTAVDGTDETAPIALPAGHYRLDWQAVGAHGTKSKTFWVKDSCAAPAVQSESPTPTPAATPVSDPSAAETASPTATATSTATPTPTATAASDVSDPTGTSTPDPSPSSVSSPAATPAGGVEDVTASASPAPDPQGQVRDATGSPAEASLPNTSLPEPPTGLLTGIGLLLVIASHPFLRRSAHADRR
jgi:methionine-rich copper-binding protein CopC